MKYILTLLLVITCIPSSVYSSAKELETILGEWVVVKDVTTTGYMTGPPEESRRLINARFSFKTNAMSVNKKKFEDISYIVKTYSADDVFWGWRIRVKELGITEKKVKVAEVVSQKEAYLEFSDFLIKNADSIVVITESGLFEMKKIKP